MHLAIAALGSGTPVLGLNHKDKMEGLFQHFGLSANHALPTARTIGTGALPSALSAFVAELPQLRAAVAARLSHVKEQAARNFDGALPG